MTVQELITALQSVEDKTAKVYYLDSYYRQIEPDGIEESKLTDGTTEVIIK